MQLTREADYAVRIMLEVASQSTGTPIPVVDVARRRLVPRQFVRKIVRHLAAVGLLRTRRGVHGGLQLARPASDISVLTIIEAAQGPRAVNRCVLDPTTCALQPTCPVHELCRLAHAHVSSLFDSATLASLVKRGQALRASAHPTRFSSEHGHGEVPHA